MRDGWLLIWYPCRSILIQFVKRLYKIKPGNTQLWFTSVILQQHREIVHIWKLLCDLVKTILILFYILKKYYLYETGKKYFFWIHTFSVFVWMTCQTKIINYSTQLIYILLRTENDFSGYYIFFIKIDMPDRVDLTYLGQRVNWNPGLGKKV